MSNALTRTAAKALANSEGQVERLRSELLCHLEVDLAGYLAREPSREVEFRQYFDSGQQRTGFVGDAVAPTTPLDLNELRDACAALLREGRPRSAFDALLEAMEQCEDFRSRYAAREYAGLSYERWENAANEFCGAALEQVPRADAQLKARADSPATGQKVAGVEIEGKEYYTTAHIMQITGSTRDAARKLLRGLERDHGLTTRRIGRAKHVEVEAFMEAL